MFFFFLLLFIFGCRGFVLAPLPLLMERVLWSGPGSPLSHVMHVMRATAPRKNMCRGQFLQRTSDSSPQDIFELVVFLASLSLFGDDVDMYGPP